MLSTDEITEHAYEALCAAVAQASGDTRAAQRAQAHMDALFAEDDPAVLLAVVGGWSAVLSRVCPHLRPEGEEFAGLAVFSAATGAQVDAEQAIAAGAPPQQIAAGRILTAMLNDDRTMVAELFLATLQGNYMPETVAWIQSMAARLIHHAGATVQRSEAP